MILNQENELKLEILKNVLIEREKMIQKDKERFLTKIHQKNKLAKNKLVAKV